MSLSAVRDITGKLYDTETRPGMVAQGLMRLGVEKFLDQKQIEFVASLTTVQALINKGVELQTIALPYIKKATHADGRKELVAEANERIVKPTRKVAAPYVQVYVDSANEKIIKPTREFAEPYVQGLVSRRDALVESPRFKLAVATVKQVREHPLEVAQELKSKAVDLIKYDDLVAYRAYVQSPEFQADTLKLLREDLPKVVMDAALRGKELLRIKAQALADEVDAKLQAIMETWKRGFELGRSIELNDVRVRALALVQELKAQVGTTVDFVKAADYNPQEVIRRLIKVFGLDKFFGVSPGAPASAPSH